MRTDRTTQSADGVVEYLVRIANVAEVAAETEEAYFSLQVEVDGFYGKDVPRYEASSPTASELGAISGELAPGFSVRSEEHTSEPQSLMRIWIAVLCLNTKKHNNTISTQLQIEEIN